MIEISMRTSGPRVEISVTDDAPGVSAAALPHLFDEFYLGDRSDSGRAGAGLGLSICKGLVDAMGGEIEVESPGASSGESRGTRFTVSFPIPVQPKTIPETEGLS